MASMPVERASSSVPSSSRSQSRTTYDVFLCFRGEDTRNNFVNHLYTALAQKGIHTFKDDEKLERGKEISPELRRAIQESSFSIVVLSKNYASSRRYLDELVETLECNNTTVNPIFYHAEPSEGRRQTGVLGMDLRNWFPNREFWGWRRRSRGGGKLWSKLPIYRDGFTQPKRFNY